MSTAPDPTYHSAAEVSGDIDRYFSGEPTTIGIFGAAFSNARLLFCSADARAKIDRTLVGWASRGPVTHESHLYDYLAMLASRHLLEELAAYLFDRIESGRRCCWPLNADPMGGAGEDRYGG